MTWEAVTVVIAIATVVLTVIGMFGQARKSAREEATARAAEDQARIDREQHRYNTGFVDGKANRQAEVDLLRSQRDDARLSRDNERLERIDCNRQVDDLERELRNVNRNRGTTP